MKRFPPTVNVRHDRPGRLKLPREELLKEFYERLPMMKLEPVDFTDDHVSLAERFIAAQEEYMLEGMEQEDAYQRCLERFKTELLAVETYLRQLQTEGGKLTERTMLSVYFRRIGSTRELNEAKTISAGARKGTLPSDWENEMFESVDIPSVDPDKRAAEKASVRQMNEEWLAANRWQEAIAQEQAGLPSAAEHGLGGQQREDRAFAAGGDRPTMTHEVLAQKMKAQQQRVSRLNALENARGALLSSVPLNISMEFRELEDREMVAQAYRFTAPGFTKMAIELCDLLDQTYDYRSAVYMDGKIDLETQESNVPESTKTKMTFAELNERHKEAARAHAREANKPKAAEATQSPVAAALSRAGPEIVVEDLNERRMREESQRNLAEMGSFPILFSKAMDGTLNEADVTFTEEEIAAMTPKDRAILARLESGEQVTIDELEDDPNVSQEDMESLQELLVDMEKIGQIYQRDPTGGAALFMNKPCVDEFRASLLEMKTMEEQAEVLRPIILAFERARHEYAVLMGQETKQNGVPLPELFEERLQAGHVRPADVDQYHATDFTKTLDAFLMRESQAAARRHQEEEEEVPMRPIPKKLRGVVAAAEERKFFNDLRLQRKQEFFELFPEKAAELEKAAVERQEQMAKTVLSRSK